MQFKIAAAAVAAVAAAAETTSLAGSFGTFVFKMESKVSEEKETHKKRTEVLHIKRDSSVLHVCGGEYG
jgi:hypothetical protein